MVPVVANVAQIIPLVQSSARHGGYHRRVEFVAARVEFRNFDGPSGLGHPVRIIGLRHEQPGIVGTAARERQRLPSRVVAVGQDLLLPHSGLAPPVQSPVTRSGVSHSVDALRVETVVENTPRRIRSQQGHDHPNTHRTNCSSHCLTAPYLVDCLVAAPVNCAAPFGPAHRHVLFA